MTTTLAAVAEDLPASTREHGAGTRSDADHRLAAARAALTKAEAAAGLRTRLPGPGLSTSPVLTGRLGADDPAAVAIADHARQDVEALPTADHALAVPAALRPLFPAGGLARGSVVQVSGSTSLLLTLAATASADGAWCALAAMPDVGWRAAAGAGLPLDRVAVVPTPGPDAAAVVGALVDGFDVLVVGPCRALAERDRRLLASRVRTREAVLLSTHPWPGAHLVLQATRPAWEGVGQGWGHLAAQELTVRATGRAGATRPAEVRVSLGPDGLRSLGPVSIAGRAAATEPAAQPLLRAV